MEHDQHPKQESNTACEFFCFAALVNTIKGTLYLDLIGKFTVQSHKGNQYIFVKYVYNENTISIRAIPNQEAVTQVQAFQEIYKYLQQ